MGKYKFIVIPLIALLTTQILKCIIETIINKKFDIWRFLDGSGGMPSTHSAFVTSLTCLIGLNKGIDSIYFAICLVFSFVVLYDAMGVRYESGKQAEAINKILKDYKKRWFFKEKTILLKEKIGHKPLEVLCGILYGIISTILLNHFI